MERRTLYGRLQEVMRPLLRLDLTSLVKLHGINRNIWRIVEMDREHKHAELNIKKWDSRAETYDDRRFNYFRFMQKRLVSLLDLKENQHLLDLGCGTGWAVRYAASIVKNKGKFYGIDISPKMIEKAKTSSSDYKNVHFYETSAEQLPFEDNFFDFIICSNSFHHYFSPSKVLNEVYRVLKPRGRIYIMDPTADGFIMKMIDKWILKKEREHVKHYSTQEYRTLFAGTKLNYINSKLITVMLVEKVHIAEKPSDRIQFAENPL
jgi:ubiquinone/menaquinone biosynthesis C-methylase UbiE